MTLSVRFGGRPDDRVIHIGQHGNLGATCSTMLNFSHASPRVMKLFHYTPKNNYALMLNSSSIRPGSVLLPNKTLGAGYAVSLTRKDSGRDLGVPTGLRIPDDVFERLQKIGPPYNVHEIRGGVPYQRDHTEVRLRVDLPNTPSLVSAKAFYKPNPKLLASLALSASTPFGVKHLTASEVDRLIEKQTAKRVAALTNDWWYHLGEIALGHIDEVAFKVPRTEVYQRIELPRAIQNARAQLFSRPEA